MIFSLTPLPWPIKKRLTHGKTRFRTQQKLSPFCANLSTDAVFVSVLFTQPFLWKTILQETLWYSDSYNLFVSFSMMSHEPWTQELEFNCMLWGQACAIYWFLHCVQLWFSVTVSIYYKEKLLWWGVVAVLIGVYKDTSLSGGAKFRR